MSPSSLSPRKSSADDKYSYVNSLLDIATSTLAASGRLIPAPYIWGAAELAASTWKMIQTTRRNKEAFLDLASDACELVFVVVHQVYGDQVNIDDKLKSSLGKLESTLTEIWTMVERDAKRGYFIRFLRHPYDIEKINKYRGKLEQIFRIYELESDISLHIKVTKILNALHISRASIPADTTESELSSSAHTTSASSRPAGTPMQPSPHSASSSSPQPTSQSTPTGFSPTYPKDTSLPNPFQAPLGSNIQYNVVHGNLIESNSGHKISNMNSNNVYFGNMVSSGFSNPGAFSANG